MNKQKEFEKAIQTAYLLQTEADTTKDITEEMVNEYGLNGKLELLKETDTHWIGIHYGDVGAWLNAVRKKDYDMETIELF
ncbi:hypothetical protein KY314_01740 [Candidatus Woesearchaeota archaeon]|nr:hypothetical protein [Candidatus Woesearchaeota archaeon]